MPKMPPRSRPANKRAMLTGWTTRIRASNVVDMLEPPVRRCEQPIRHRYLEGNDEQEVGAHRYGGAQGDVAGRQRHPQNSTADRYEERRGHGIAEMRQCQHVGCESGHQGVAATRVAP